MCRRGLHNMNDLIKSRKRFILYYIHLFIAIFLFVNNSFANQNRERFINDFCLNKDINIKCTNSFIRFKYIEKIDKKYDTRSSIKSQLARIIYENLRLEIKQFSYRAGTSTSSDGVIYRAIYDFNLVSEIDDASTLVLIRHDNGDVILYISVRLDIRQDTK